MYPKCVIMKIPWERIKDIMITINKEEKMNYIYCYTNKINQHKYVGQTNNLKRRIREHKSCAFNEKSLSYNDLIHKKIREYGEENFQIDVLEILYTDDKTIVNERESYWIKEKNSYCGNGLGYNMDKGGNRKYESSILTNNQLKELKEDIKKGKLYLDLQNKYNVSTSFISSINQGIYFYDNNEKYPLYKYYKDDSDYDDLINLLLNSTYTLSKIASMLNMGESTVKKINEGRLRKGIYPNYPIRKKSVNEMRADKIKDLLINSNYSKKEIVEMTKSSNETVRRINIGESFKDDKLKYPLRNL